MTSVDEFSTGSTAVDRYLRQPYARIILPESDGSFRGEIMEFPGCIAIGNSAAEALKNLEEAAKGWLFSAIELGQNIPQPVENSNDFSGRLVLRLPKSIHKKASWIAEREGVSLNQFITASLAESVGERQKSRNAVVLLAQTTHVNYAWVTYNHNAPKEESFSLAGTGANISAPLTWNLIGSTALLDSSGSGYEPFSASGGRNDAGR